MNRHERKRNRVPTENDVTREGHGEGDRQKPATLWKGLLGGLILVIYLSSCFYVSDLLWDMVFFNRSSGGIGMWMLDSLLTAASAIFLALAGLRLFLLIYQRRHLEHRRGQVKRHFKYMEDAFDALDQIAAGNFNIFLEVEGYGHHGDMAEKINNMARELQSMELMRQDFISNVSHELQSPLTSINGFAELLKNEDLSPEQRLHYLEVIQSESRRMSKLSENLLKLSVLDGEESLPDPEVFSLDKQLESVLLMLEPHWSKKDLELAVDLEKVRIRGNADLLSQVWINLVHNSIKFSHDGGVLKVTLSAEEAADTGSEESAAAGIARETEGAGNETARTGIAENQGFAVVTVEDKGIGIPESDRMHIFERFYKVDKSRDRAKEGNGLGLSLVKRIVELHQGSISVSGKEGEGSVFTVKLPLGVTEFGAASEMLTPPL